ncbi:MAG: permease [Clostridia bacterium]|nr:permease [Clostridia bacterium]
MNQNKNLKKWLGIALALILVAGIAVWCGINGANAKGIASTFKVSAVTALPAGIFIVAALGYLLGSISVKGVSLGTAGVFLVAILFGYLCTLEGLREIPILNQFYIGSSSSQLNVYYSKIVQNIGLVLFVASVGFIAGPNFFKNLKKNAKSFVLLGGIIICTGALVAVLFALIPGIGARFSVGVLSGALTTTPGFSAAIEAAESLGQQTDIITLGHAIAYPFGVIGVVLFVQLIPKFLKADMNRERELLKADAAVHEEKKKNLFTCDPFGITPFAMAVIAGLILGSISIPLSGKGYAGPCFSLGTTGGVLIMTLIFGHFGAFGKLSLIVPETTAKVFREFGLMMFLIGAGVSGGVSLVSEIGKSELGAMIVVYGLIGGALMTVIPMIIGFLFAKYVLKLSLLNNLGSITGGMTSTPALGTLINTAKTDDVAAAYASTYPIALVLIVLASQLIITLMA